MATTIGKVLISEALPNELQDINEPITKDKLDSILGVIAEKYPDKYKEISLKLMQLGADASFDEGITLGLKDTLVPTQSRDFWLKHIAAQRKKIMATKDSESDKLNALSQVYEMVHKQLVDETYDSAIGANNPFALQVKSKARGNKLQLSQLMTTPGVFQDAEGKTIPIFISRSYAEGLKPHEFWAATYGTRKSVIATKLSTQDAGYLGKQYSAAATKLVVAAEDCGTDKGIPVEADDADNIGALLARDTLGFKAGTVITKEVLNAIKSKKIDNIVVRSPLTCQLPKGLCKHCVGIRDGNKFSHIGDYVGISAASSVAERIAQGALNCLSEGTLVRMADNSVLPIEAIKVGDIVLGADVMGNTFPVKVNNTWDQGTQPVRVHMYYVVDTYISIICTDIHKLLAKVDTAYVKIPAGDLCNDLVVLGGPDYTKHELGKRVAAAPLGQRHCHDISVDHPDSLFVLANGIICSNTKHSGGQSLKNVGDDEYAGFGLIEQFAQVPESFKHRATLATEAGAVNKIEPASQGGTNVYINNQLHYILPNQEVRVKLGDSIDPGDQISSGIIDPSELVKYKGIGAGRLYYANRLKNLLRNSGFDAHRRNLEILSRGVIDHVRAGNNVDSNTLPGEVINYNTYAYNYKPRVNTQTKNPDESRGMYLEQPILHYTIGTHVDKSMIDTLKKNNITALTVHKDPVDYEPFMPSLREVPSYEEDWMAQLGSSYLQTNLLKNIHTGAESSVKGQHPLPGIAKGVDFMLKSPPK